jgi:hypothetical protein
MRAGSSSLFGVDDNGKARLIMSAKRENPIVITVSALEKRDLRTRDSRRSRYRTGHGCYQGYVAILAFGMSIPRSRSATCGPARFVAKKDDCRDQSHFRLSRTSEPGTEFVTNRYRRWTCKTLCELSEDIGNIKTTGLRRSISSHHL